MAEGNDFEWGAEGSIVQSVVDDHINLIKKMVKRGFNPNSIEKEQNVWWNSQKKQKSEMARII